MRLHSMSPAKTTSERVDKLRKEREALGLTRREIYAHDDDWPQIKAMALKLQMKRRKALAKQQAGLTSALTGLCRPQAGTGPVE